MWLVQTLREQSELLELVLLYYKDYDHLTPDLTKTAKLFQVQLTLSYGPSQSLLNTAAL